MRKKEIPLTIEENKSYHNQKVCYICKKEFNTLNNDKVKDHCHFIGKYRRAAYNICNLRYKIPKGIPTVFHNDYHFIIKELAEECEGELECLGENAEKYITFSVTIKNDKGKKYKIEFIDSYMFMSSSLSRLVDNLSDGIYNDKCIDCKSCLDYTVIKDDQLVFRCFECKKKNK